MMDDLRRAGFTSEVEAKAERWLELDSRLEIEDYEECIYYVVGLDHWFGIPQEAAHGKV